MNEPASEEKEKEKVKVQVKEKEKEKKNDGAKVEGNEEMKRKGKLPLHQDGSTIKTTATPKSSSASRKMKHVKTSSSAFGKKVIGEWQLEKRLGSGSFASVFLAKHQRFQEKQVAIKAISKSKLNKKLEKNLQKEIHIMQKMSHENIVTLYETYDTNRHIYLVMEFCEGGDLHVLLRKHGALSLETAKIFMQQLGAGMKYLWSQNLIHRDLKPQNLLLTGTGNERKLKIADFGFATHLAEAAMADTMCGSPLYMAPEILDGRKYDSKADLWSAGTILFEMLVGKPPFHGSSPRELLRNILKQKLRFPTSKVKISPDCGNLLSNLLNPNPIERISFEDFSNHPFIVIETKTNYSDHHDKSKVHEQQEDEDSSLPDSSLSSSSSSETSIFGASDMLLSPLSSEASGLGGEKLVEKGKDMLDQRQSNEQQKRIQQEKGHRHDHHHQQQQDQQNHQMQSRHHSSDDAWEIVQRNDEFKKKSRKTKQSLKHTKSDQLSNATHVIRYAGELLKRTQDLKQIISSLERADPDDLVFNALSKLHHSPKLSAFALEIKALQILKQALDACETVTGFADEKFVLAARLTRDDIKLAFHDHTNSALRLESVLSQNETNKTSDDLSQNSVQQVMLWIVAELGEAAGNQELLARKCFSEKLVDGASNLLEVSISVLDLLCADPLILSEGSTDERTYLLGLKAVLQERLAIIKSLKSQIQREVHA